MRFGPGLGREILDLPVGGSRQPGEHIAQISVWIYAAPPAALHQRVKDRSAISRVFFSDEEPVLFAYGGGPDRIFHQVIVDLHAAIHSQTQSISQRFRV